MLKNSYTSYSKLNLGLRILNKRNDGLHNIESIFIEINFADVLIFSPASKFSLTIQGNEKQHLSNDDTNLVTQSYKLLKNIACNVPQEFKIILKKNIPLGSGLGGGSSNAAKTLCTLNKLWNMNLKDIDLEKLGQKLGADIPFFIKGGVQVVSGIGDRLKPINPKPITNLFFLLVIPNINISTTWAYSQLNKTLLNDKKEHKFAPLSDSMKWGLFENDFERVICETYPEISHIIKSLQKAGSLYASLSGSGSTVFGVFDDLQKANSLKDSFIQYRTFLASPVFR